ncbi:MAG: hypothetical protein IEMM0008_0131 [bacterium]|nr:MAG: hypothetical protein IEMM0008_0131 [bacterium]
MANKRVTRESLAKNTKVQLIAIGKKLKLKGLHSLKKAEVIDCILGKQNVKKVKAAGQKRASNKILEESHKGSANQSSSFPTPAERQVKSYKDDIELPSNYEETRIVAMIKDPEWVYAYWDVGSQDYVKYDLAHRRMALRIYDITAVTDFNGMNAQFSYDIDVYPDSRNWFIKVPESNKDYCIDIGYFDDNGLFQVITRSNVVSVPRNNISDVYDEHWMVIEELFELSGGDESRFQQNGSFETEQMLAERMKMAISSGVLVSSWDLSSSEDLSSGNG